MILRSVTLQDFGVYAGSTTLDLVSRSEIAGAKPVVLIGGKNGVGKTTFLEAVRLALYGKRALGSRVGQSEYDNYLRGKVNWNSASEGASVALEFDYAEAGTLHRYRVRREWAVRGRSVVENLDLLKDGFLMSSVPPEEWQNFLQELIPPGVSQLFFFDGEKISQIADGENDDEQLGAAIRALLGMDLVSRLRVDLGLYMARQQKDNSTDLRANLENVGRNVEIAKQRADVIGDEVAELTTQRDSQARAAEQVRRQFVSEGGDAAAQRDRIEAEVETVKRAVHRAEHELRDSANKLLPFAMAPKLIASFRDALIKASTGTSGVSADKLSKVLTLWRDAADERKADWTPQHWEDLEQFLASRKDANGPAIPSAAIREVGDGTGAITRLHEVETLVRPHAAALLSDLDRLTSRLAELTQSLSRADNASAGVLLDDLQRAERRLGATEATLATRSNEWQLVKGQLSTLEREQRRILDDQAGANRTQHRSGLAARASQALAAYEDRLLRHKLEQLRGEFVRLFNHLARKSSPISDMQIDPTTFATTLIDAAGRATPKTALSEGEKQIYAISMLWALARTSGRPLPMIIDTPLARLDSDHRRNIVERYFPEASHQVIILSTDTEIDAALYQKLEPSVSHSYLLDFDQNNGRTEVSSGYFAQPSDLEGGPRALQQA